MINSTKCVKCGKTSESEVNLLHVEIDVPPNGSALHQYVEEVLNDGFRVDYSCHEGCHMNDGAVNRMMVKSCKDTEILIVILRRVIQDATGPILLQNSTESTSNINLR